MAEEQQKSSENIAIEGGELETRVTTSGSEQQLQLQQPSTESLLATSIMKQSMSELLARLSEPDVCIEDGEVLLRRPLLQEYFARGVGGGISAASDRASTKKTGLSETEKLERSMRIKQIEVERKKALKEARQRARMKRINDAKKNEEEKVTRQFLKVFFFSAF